MKEMLRVLMVEDSEDDAFLMERALKEGGYDVQLLRIDSEEGMRKAFDASSWDAVIADYSLPNFNGLQALALLKERKLDIPFILVSGTIGEELAVQAMKSGAHDYIMKANMARLAPAVRRELKQAHMRSTRRKAVQTVKRMNEELVKANAELRSMDEMKTNLLANVSHELRTPLVTIKGYAELIQTGESGPVNGEQKRQLGVALRNIDRLMVLINNLLEFSSLQFQEGFRKERMDFRPLLDECWQANRSLFRAKNINHRLELPAEAVFVECDRDKLQRVFANLFDNAQKFTPQNGTVVCTLKAENGRAEASVVDTGIGIPKPMLRKVFDRFFQVDATTTRRHGGVGIGLSISKEIIEHHSGVLAVQSRDGEGATFTVVLPLAS